MSLRPDSQPAGTILSHFPVLCIGDCPWTPSLLESQLEVERTSGFSKLPLQISEQASKTTVFLGSQEVSITLLLLVSTRGKRTKLSPSKTQHENHTVRTQDFYGQICKLISLSHTQISPLGKGVIITSEYYCSESLLLICKKILSQSGTYLCEIKFFKLE